MKPASLESFRKMKDIPADLYVKHNLSPRAAAV